MRLSFKYLSSFALLASAAFISQPAQAEIVINDDLSAFAYLKNQYVYEENRDLGQLDDDSSESKSIELRAGLLYSPTDYLDFYGEGRVVRTFGDQFIDEQTGEAFRAEKFAELRQLWARMEWAGLDGLATQIGRQRIREDRGLWWNDDVDAVRMIYDSSVFSGFLGVSENLNSYKTSDDDFDADEQDRLRFLAEGSWLLPYNHYFDVRALYENDHSGVEPTGTFVEADQQDDEDNNNLLWAGVRAWSDLRPVSSGSDLQFSYRADLIGVIGEADEISTSAGPGSRRTVTGSEKRDVRAWAFDAEVDVAAPAVPFKPVFTLGYAYGSGDDDTTDNTDTAFRQSDMHSNTSYNAGASRAVHNYGEVLRPELSNLHIANVGATLNFTPHTDFTVMYHKYWLAEKETDLRSTRIRPSVNGTDNDVGQSVNLSLNSDLEDQFNFDMPVADGVSFRSSAGAFMAGDAYGPNADDDVVWRGLAEIQFSF